MFEWNQRSGRYRNTRTKRFVKRSEVLAHINRQNTQSKAFMQTQAQKLINRDITLGTFQRRMVAEIKRSNVRMALLAAGGKDGAGQRELGSVGAIVRQEYRFLRGFVRAISRGELTPERIIWRAGLYGRSSSESFFASEKINRVRNTPDNLIAIATRRLDSAAAHCEDCPNYDTNGQWRLAEDVVEPTRRCACMHSCRCSIRYRYVTPAQAQNILSDRLIS